MPKLAAFLLCFLAFRSADGDGIGLIFGFVAIVVIVIALIARSLGGNAPEASLLIEAPAEGARYEQFEVSDHQFEEVTQQAVPLSAREKAFYAKVAGVSHLNSDGSSRARIIAHCKALDPLELCPEPENQFDPNAIAVRHLKTREQLGYLDKRLASEVAADFRKNGARWLAMFRHPNHNPENGMVVGAVIYLICLAEDGAQ